MSGILPPPTSHILHVTENRYCISEDTYNIKEQQRIVEVWIPCSVFDDLGTNSLTPDLDVDAWRHHTGQLELSHAPDAPTQHLQDNIPPQYRQRKHVQSIKHPYAFSHSFQIIKDNNY